MSNFDFPVGYRSINAQNWKRGQLPKARYNTPSLQYPWFRCITFNKVMKSDGIAAYYYPEHGNANTVKAAIMENFPYFKVRESTRTGYLKRGHFVVAPYLGQWGKGWFVAENNAGSGSSVKITYYTDGKGSRK